MQKIRRAFVPLALLVFVSVLAAAQNKTSRVEGKVLDPQGEPLVHATVKLHNTLSNIDQLDETDNTGLYAFSEVIPGDYILIALSPGLAEQASSISVKPSTVLHAPNLTLPIATVQQAITVVSASRAEELQQESPLPLDVVSSQRIQRTGYESVANVLSELPGVVTRNNVSFSGQSQQQIDGIASQDILVLQDGLPIVGARGIKSGIVDIDQQDIGKLDRIEVVRGAASSLYGTDALGGVINMITHEPTHPLEGGLRISGGSLGAVDSDLTLGTTWKKFSAFTDLESHHVGSYTLIPGDESTIGANADRYDGLVKLLYGFTPRFSLGFTASAYHNDATGKTVDFSGLATSGYAHATSNDSMQNYALTANLAPTNSTALQFRLYEARYDENSYQNPINDGGVLGDQFDYGNLYERYHRADGTISQQIGSRQFVQAGYEWVQDSYRGLNRMVGDDRGQQVTTNDVWIQDRIQPFSRLTITLGGRFNHHSLYGSHVVPKVGMVARLTNRWTARAAYGKGFRSPTLGELYYLLVHPEYFYQVIGNPSLSPERSDNFSVGSDYQINRFRVGVTLYRNNLNHLINFIPAGFPTSQQELDELFAQYGIPAGFGGQPFLATYVYTNVDRAYTQGVNLSGSVLLTQNLRVDAAYAYLDPYDTINHQTLTERSRNSGFFKTEYANNRWGFVANIRGNFFGRWLIDPSDGTHENAYSIWSLYASKDIHGGLQIYGAIDNLNDSRDSLLAQNPPTYDRTDYGRTFRLGMRYMFSHE